MQAKIVSALDKVSTKLETRERSAKILCPSLASFQLYEENDLGRYLKLLENAKDTAAGDGLSEKEGSPYENPQKSQLKAGYDAEFSPQFPAHHLSMARIQSNSDRSGLGTVFYAVICYKRYCNGLTHHTFCSRCRLYGIRHAAIWCGESIHEK